MEDRKWTIHLVANYAISAPKKYHHAANMLHANASQESVSLSSVNVCNNCGKHEGKLLHLNYGFCCSMPPLISQMQFRCKWMASLCHRRNGAKTWKGLFHMLNLLAMTSSLCSRNCESTAQKPVTSAAADFFLFNSPKLTRTICKCCIVGHELHRFLGQYFFGYAFRSNRMLIFFFFFLLPVSFPYLLSMAKKLCGKKRATERQRAVRHMIQAKGCAIIWKFTLVTVPMVA